MKVEDITKDKLICAIKRVAKLYFVWTLIYLPITILGFYRSSSGIVKSIILFTRNVLFIGENQNSWILWYLLSCLFALVLIYILKFIVKTNTVMIFAISFLFLLVSYALPFIYQIEWGNEFKTIIHILELLIPNGRLLTGFFYIIFGIVISQKRGPFLLNKFIIFCFLLLVFSVSIMFKQLFLPKYFQSLFNTLNSNFMFLFAISLNIKTNKCTLFFRKSSTIMYFVHMIIFTLFSLISSNVFQNYGLTAFLVVFSVSFSFCFIIIPFQTKSNFIYSIFN